MFGLREKPHFDHAWVDGGGRGPQCAHSITSSWCITAWTHASLFLQGRVVTLVVVFARYMGYGFDFTGNSVLVAQLTERLVCMLHHYRGGGDCVA